MRERKYRYFICWGITAFCVIAASIAFGFFLLKIDMVKAAIGTLTEILAPVIYGAVLAYLLTPIYNRYRNKSEVFLKSKMKNEKKAVGLAKSIATAISLVVLLVIVAGLCSMLIPQLITSIRSIVDGLPSSLTKLSLWMENAFNDNEEIAALATSYLDQMYEWINHWAREVFFPNMDKIITSLSSGLMSVIVLFKNLLIGLIVMVYLLNIKDGIVTVVKKMVYSLFSVKAANRVIAEGRYIHKVFGGFIIGKLLDSLIIGILCFVCVSLMKMPYALLVSVIVGATNVIPFFGPFIGAIPSAFLILLVDPKQCLYFLIFILLLQQFDGNILGPKILGDSTGISSFGVLFSILLFGGLFGFVGMIIGVPTFAVIQNLVNELMELSLKRKRLPEDIESYEKLDYVQEKDKKFIHKNK